MAATIATMAILNPKSLTINSINPRKPSIPPKPISPLPIRSIPNTLSVNKPLSSAIAGALFSTLSSSNPAFASQQIAQIAEGDNRGIALLLPLIPAIAWVLFNILQPALNQVNRMRETRGVLIGLGLAGLAAATAAEASAGEIAAVAAEAASDNRGQLLLFVVAPAIAWVLYNILQPALNQINRMRSD